jgi:hypothetical protein
VRVVAGNGDRGPLISAAVVVGAMGLLSLSVLANTRMKETAVLLVVAAAAAGHRILLRWPALIALTIIVILFIPVKRYTLPGSLPFDLEPYRLLVALLLAAWIASLLTDLRVRIERSGFEAPLAAIVLATLGSEIANPGRARELEPYVIKSITFFASFVLFFYLVVGLVRTRHTLDFLIKVLVAGAAAVATSALYERRTGVNVFNELEGVVPLLTLEGAAFEERGGAVRAYASAAHPIELSVVLAMLTPLALYLTVLRRRWWIAVLLLALGSLAAGSRTGVVGLLVAGLVFAWLRPKATKRLWPLLVPAVVVIHFALPGALGGIKEGFFPKGGLVAEQSHTVPGNERLANNRIADLGPSLEEFSAYNPLFGQGYATRVTGFGEEFVNAAILDNQWLRTLLETGLIGLFAWMWIFGRSIRGLGRAAKADPSAGGYVYVSLAGSLAAFAA